MPNAFRCHSPALKGRHFCYYHPHLHCLAKAPTPSSGEPLKFPVLEDRSTIQMTVTQVFNALGSSRSDPRRAGIFLYGLQIASQNVQRNCDIHPISAVESMTQTPDGDDLAPEKRVCYSFDNCPNCEFQDTCENSTPAEEEEDERL
jgi:hypothetical protein